MKQRHHTPEKVMRKLAEADKLLAHGTTIEEVARHLEISEQTFHRWRNQNGGMKADDAKELRELAQGDAQLKKLWPRRSWTRPCSRRSTWELLTPDCRRRAVRALCTQFGVSERRTCRVVGQSKSTQRLAAPVPSDDELVSFPRLGGHRA